MSATQEMTLPERFTEMARGIPYPEIPPRPRREDFNSHKAHGIAMDEWEKAAEIAKKGREEYRNKQYEVEQKFKAAVAKEFGLGKHPKFGRMFEIAWNEGHSSGFNEVYNYCETLASLLTD